MANKNRRLKSLLSLYKYFLATYFKMLTVLVKVLLAKVLIFLLDIWQCKSAVIPTFPGETLPDQELSTKT